MALVFLCSRRELKLNSPTNKQRLLSCCIGHQIDWSLRVMHVFSELEHCDRRDRHARGCSVRGGVLCRSGQGTRGKQKHCMRVLRFRIITPTLIVMCVTVIHELARCCRGEALLRGTPRAIVIETSVPQHRLKRKTPVANMAAGATLPKGRRVVELPVGDDGEPKLGCSKCRKRPQGCAQCRRWAQDQKERNSKHVAEASAPAAGAAGKAIAPKPRYLRMPCLIELRS